MPRVRDNPYLMYDLHTEATDFIKKLAKEHRLAEEEICRRLISIFEMIVPYLEKPPQQKEI